MGPLTRVRQVLRTLTKQKPPYYWPVYEQGEYHWQMTSYESYASEGYGGNSPVFSAIAFKCRAISQAPLRAYVGDPDNPERLPATHPLAILVNRPNEHQSWMEFQQLCTVYLNIAGNAYIFLNKPVGGGLPTAMYTLRPDRVKIVPKDGGVIGYAYYPQGMGTGRSNEFIPILPEYLLHIKLPNPLDPYEGMGYGMSPLMPAAKSGDIDNAVTEFLYQFFKSGAMGLGAISFDVPIDAVDMAEIQRKFEDKYGGAAKWRHPIFLDNGGKWQPITPPFKDMGFMEIDSRNETRLLGPLGVPPILIGTRAGLERSTFSNYGEAETTFWQITMIPELLLYEVDFDYYLRDGEAFVRYDTSKVPALQADLAPVVESFFKLFQTGVPRAIAARVVGLEIEQHEGDDVSYLPFGTVLAESLELPPEPPPGTEAPPEDEPPAEETPPEGEAGGEETAPKAYPARTGPGLERRYWQHWNAATLPGGNVTPAPPLNNSSLTAALSRLPLPASTKRRGRPKPTSSGRR